jgi:hypothetical protein
VNRRHSKTKARVRRGSSFFDSKHGIPSCMTGQRVRIITDVKNTHVLNIGEVTGEWMTIESCLPTHHKSTSMRYGRYAMIEKTWKKRSHRFI